MKDKITYQSTYNGFLINVRPGSGCYTNILDKIIERFEYALQKHSKILMIRIDINYPEGYSVKDNSIFQSFFENYIRYLQRKGFDPVYLWCSELGARNQRLHHHVYLLLNSNNIRWMPNLRKAEELWSRALGMYPVIPNNCVKRILPTEPEDDDEYNNNRILYRLLEAYCVIHRWDDEALCEAVYWGSYLAKEYTKTVYGSRMFGCTQLPKGWRGISR